MQIGWVFIDMIDDTLKPLFVNAMILGQPFADSY